MPRNTVEAPACGARGVFAFVILCTFRSHHRPIQDAKWRVLMSSSWTRSVYYTKFFIRLLEKAFKMMKNGVYFIVIALFVAELFDFDLCKLDYLWRHIVDAKNEISLKTFSIFLVFTHVMRRPCWCTKQWQNVARVLHNNRIKFPKDFFRYCSVHQHGRRDVTWKPRIELKLCTVVTHHKVPWYVHCDISMATQWAPAGADD